MRILALAAILACSGVHAETCKPWSNPGANKNTQWPSISTAHYRPDLADRVEARAYDEIVVVKGGRIVGEVSGRSYSNLRDMHYGNGKFCTGPVELPPITENEFGFVYCTSDDRCVIDWFICHNISQVDRDAQKDSVLSRPENSILSEAPPNGVSIPGTNGPVISAGTPAEYGTQSYGGYGYSQGSGFGGGGFYSGGGSCYCCEFPPVTPVPEPTTYLYLLAGIGAIAWKRNKFFKGHKI